MLFGDLRVSCGQTNGHDRPTDNHTTAAGKVQQPLSQDSGDRELVVPGKGEHLVNLNHTGGQVKTLVWHKRP